MSLSRGRRDWEAWVPSRQWGLGGTLTALRGHCSSLRFRELGGQGPRKQQGSKKEGSSGRWPGTGSRAEAGRGHRPISADPQLPGWGAVPPVSACPSPPLLQPSGSVSCSLRSRGIPCATLCLGVLPGVLPLCPPQRGAFFLLTLPLECSLPGASSLADVIQPQHSSRPTPSPQGRLHPTW